MTRRRSRTIHLQPPRRRRGDTIAEDLIAARVGMHVFETGAKPGTPFLRRYDLKYVIIWIVGKCPSQCYKINMIAIQVFLIPFSSQPVYRYGAFLVCYLTSAPKSVPAYPNYGVCSVGDLFSDLSLARMSARRYPSNRGIDRLLN